jgi:hypothetical protein
MVLRARGSALFTAAVVVLSVPATSCAENPRTSRRMSTARCVAGDEATIDYGTLSGAQRFAMMRGRPVGATAASTGSGGRRRAWTNW